ncbi:MAG: hypothetical protein WCR20_03400 [Verrucomicrobiota bacterium]
MMEAEASPGLNYALDLPPAPGCDLDSGPVPVFDLHGWPTPFTVSTNPEEARALITLPEFDPLVLAQARAISDWYPQAEQEHRTHRTTVDLPEQQHLPHFEKVFRAAATLGGVPEVENSLNYDTLLILTAWHVVRPGVGGFLTSYPKALLCPLPHLSPPTALAALSPREQIVFERRAPIYLRFLLMEKFRLRTCSELETADMRHLLRSAGFRLIRPSTVPEFCFPGITRGDDPPVRPWKLTLRQELNDERTAELLITAGIWKIKHGLGLVSLAGGKPVWHIGAFRRTVWEDAFLSLGVRVAPSLMRPSGLLDWRGVLSRCIDRIGRGNLPPEVLGKVASLPQRICHDDDQSIWNGLDQVARTVMERVRTTEQRLFTDGGDLDYEAARSFRCWARYFDEISPQILSRFGVSAFTALRRIAPRHFGWGCAQIKPWEVEQEHGKWKGPRGRARLRSAYSYALYDLGLGTICEIPDRQTSAIDTAGESLECKNRDAFPQVFWQCTLSQFCEWHQMFTSKSQASMSECLYQLARRHGLTPLLNCEISHAAAISLLAGINLHQSLPKIEGSWDLCMRTALEHHGGQMELRLDLPDLVPLPLRLRKAALTPVASPYLHQELRLVRDFDLRMARESRRQLIEIPGWWEDERVAGTPLAVHLQNKSHPALPILRSLRHDPWLEPGAQRPRFRALNLLLSPGATSGGQISGKAEPRDPSRHPSTLSSEEIRTLLQFAHEATLLHTNLSRAAIQPVRRAFERLLARRDTREMLYSLLLHVGTASETEAWGHVRKFTPLDVVNDVVKLTIRSSLLHLMNRE